jgi:hypothetical protein
MVAEEISVSYDWIDQLKRTSMVCDHSLGWDDTIQGYDLNVLTEDRFDRFSSIYLYDMTGKRIIPEITSDDKIRSEVSHDTYINRFFRSGDYLIFQPDMAEGSIVSFYYQTGCIGYELVDGKKVLTQDFSNDSFYSVLDDRLIVRGAASRFKAAISLDNSQDQAVFDRYYKLVEGARSPKGIIHSFNCVSGFANAIDLLGLPIF